MIPQNHTSNLKFVVKEEPSKTYRIDFERKQIRGMCDSLEAVEQAVSKILRTERFQSLVYSWNYGVEFQSLYGGHPPYVLSEVKERIREALLQDDRVVKVGEFEVLLGEKGKVSVSFTVETKVGKLRKEVQVDV